MVSDLEAKTTEIEGTIEQTHFTASNSLELVFKKENHIMTIEYKRDNSNRTTNANYNELHNYICNKMNNSLGCGTPIKAALKIQGEFSENKLAYDGIGTIKFL